MMPMAHLLILILIFFATSVVGVVTGSNSLITVPAMFQFGVEPRIAVATNMFGLLFMAIGGTIPFLRQKRIDRDKVRPLILLTLVSSAAGALLVGVVSDPGLKVIVSTAMIVMMVFMIAHRTDSAESPQEPYSRVITYGVVFLLGIYGGFYSGGYVTMLTAVCIHLYGMSYGEAVGSTKLINVFSCAVATAVFMWQGLVDYRLGAILAVAMFAGGLIGGHFASRFSDVWLRRIFMSTVLLLAAKTLYDFL